MEKSFLENMIDAERGGKKAAIHAYDKMMWTVRSGYLTLVFGGWALFIKSAIDNKMQLIQMRPFVFLLSGFTMALSMGAYLIDRNYARRKFRVITAVNELVQLLMTSNIERIQKDTKAKLTSLLQISGDAANKTYKSKAFTNEITVSRIIYLLPCIIIVAILVYYLINY